MFRSQKTRSVFSVVFPFGWGNIAKLSLIYFVSTLYFYAPVATLYLQGRGLNYLQINSLWGIIVGTMFLTEIPTGMLADRLGRKRAISIALALQLVGEIIFVFADTYWLFALASIAGGLGFAFSSGCIEALVFDSLEAVGRDSAMSEAMGSIDAAQKLGNLLAYVVGGLLTVTLTDGRFLLAVVLTACAVAIGFLTTLTLKETHLARPANGRVRSLALLADGIRTLRHNRTFVGLVLLSLATVPFADYLLGLAQPRLIAAGTPALWLGLSRAIGAGVSILGARYAYRLESLVGPKVSLFLVTALPGVMHLLMAMVAHPAGSVLVFCGLVGSTSLRGPILSGHVNRHIESQNRATVLSLISMFSGIYVALMGLVIGRIGDVSLPMAFATMGAIVLIGAVIFGVK
jgi:MFS family permease